VIIHQKTQISSSRPFHAEMGASHILELRESNEPANEQDSLQVVRANSVKIYWQIPQIFVIAVGEVLVSVTGLEFAYSQSAPSMKSVLQVGATQSSNLFLRFLGRLALV
jgi:hypothetical protein